MNPEQLGTAQAWPVTNGRHRFNLFRADEAEELKWAFDNATITVGNLRTLTATQEQANADI